MGIENVKKEVEMLNEILHKQQPKDITYVGYFYAEQLGAVRAVTKRLMEMLNMEEDA